MKNAIVLLISATLSFSSCQKVEVAPDYSGIYTSGVETSKSASGSTVATQYKATVTHNVQGNLVSVSLKETKSILNSSGTSAVYSDDYFYNISEVLIENSQSSVKAIIAQNNSKGALVANIYFNGTLTYSVSNLVYRGSISSIPVVITLNK
jgi:hypothetical protein